MYPSAVGCVRDEITKRSRTHVILHPFPHPPFPVIHAARLVRLSGPVTTTTDVDVALSEAASLSTDAALTFTIFFSVLILLLYIIHTRMTYHVMRYIGM